MYSVCIPQKNKLNPFHGLMLLPKPYGVERRVLVFAKVKCIKYTVYIKYTYTLFDGLTYNMCGYFASYVIFFGAP